MPWVHPEKITVCCGLWGGGGNGPYFLMIKTGTLLWMGIATVQWLPDILAPIGWYGLGGQQDGVTRHTTDVTMILLETKFGESVISRNGTVGWPPRSFDLTPLDYFLWSYVNYSSIGRFMLENRQKLGLASELLQAYPWWPCKRNRVSFIMASNVLLQE